MQHVLGEAKRQVNCGMLWRDLAKDTAGMCSPEPATFFARQVEVYRDSIV